MNFFSETAYIRRRIKESVEKEISCVGDERIQKILLQRQQTASFIKGISAFYLHLGLSGPFSEVENLRFCAAIEICSTGLVISDNIVDNHLQRNGVTTFLEEYGVPLNLLAVQYATHFGLISFGPYVEKFHKLTAELGIRSIPEVLLGVLTMDVDHPDNPQKAMQAIARVNGLTLAVPLALAASTASDDKKTITDVFQYAYNTGIAFGLYEELRDLLGEHGRKRASELLSGRMPYCLLLCAQNESGFDARKYAGNELNDEKYTQLLYELKRTGSIRQTTIEIEQCLSLGIESIAYHLSNQHIDVFKLLANTVTDDMRRLTSI